MPYRLIVSPTVRRKLVRWNLDRHYDGLLVDAYLFLGRLASNPHDALVRTRVPWDGLTGHYSVVDRNDRLREHNFLFHVFYGADEETIIIANAAYQSWTL